MFSRLNSLLSCSNESLSSQASGTSFSSVSNESSFWGLIASTDFKAAKKLNSLISSKHNQVNGMFSSAKTNLFSTLLDLEGKYHALKWPPFATTATSLSVLKERYGYLYEMCLRTASASGLADDLDIAAVLLIIRIRLGLLSIYPVITSPSNETLSLLIELATAVKEYPQTEDCQNEFILALTFELSILWFLSLSHSYIQLHYFQDAVLSLGQCGKVWLEWKDMISPRSSSRLVVLLNDLVKKLQIKVGVCFFKTIHPKEVGISGLSTQPQVRFHEDIRAPYLLPFLDLYDTFKPFNMSIFYLPKNQDHQSSFQNGYQPVDLSLLAESHQVLFSPASIKCPKDEQPNLLFSPTSLQFKFRQSFECEGSESSVLEGVNSFPVVFSFPQEHTPIEYLPNMVSLILHYKRYKINADGDGIIPFQFATKQSTRQEGDFNLAPGFGLAFPDSNMNCIFVFARLDQYYLLAFVIKGVVLAKHKELALLKVVRGISRALDPLMV